MFGSKMLAVDDLGAEPLEVVDFGNITCPMVELITYRYEHRLFTAVSTNLTPHTIREKYGDRIADRFNEMMEKVIFSDITYRK